MARKFNRKNLGRLAERCAHRVLRDAWGLKVLIQGEETYLPGFDVEAIRSIGGEHVSYWIQVKGTQVNYREGFKLHYRKLKEIQRCAMTNIIPPDKWAICGVVFEKSTMYFWTQHTIEKLIRECEENAGKVITPGLQVLDYEHAINAYALTRDELAEYQQIVTEYEIHQDDPNKDFFG